MPSLCLTRAASICLIRLTYIHDSSVFINLVIPHQKYFPYVNICNLRAFAPYLQCQTSG